MPIAIHSLRLPVQIPNTSSPFTLLPRPNPIDTWLTRNYMTHCRDYFAPEYLHIGDIPHDQVVCTVQLHKSRQISGCSIFYLMIYVTVPESSGLHVSQLSSPIATLGCYQGSVADPLAPLWTRITPGIPLELRQHRGNMAEIFTTIAFWQENRQFKQLAASMLQWAVGISRDTSAHGVLLAFAPPRLTTQAAPTHSVRRQSKRSCGIPARYKDFVTV